MRVSKGAQARADRPASYLAWLPMREGEAVTEIKANGLQVQRSIAIPHEFPRCVMKAYARSRARAAKALGLILRGPTPVEVQAVERRYLREGGS